jgi:hypothetical protein
MSHSESAITMGKTKNDAAAAYQVFVKYMLIQLVSIKPMMD